MPTTSNGKYGERRGSLSPAACERIKTNLIYFLIILIVVLIGMLCYAFVVLFEEETNVLDAPFERVATILPKEQKFWYEKALNELSDSMNKYEPNERRAKNIILFVGDGMGISTVTGTLI